ncbi:MAG TPA: ATP-dependent DNA helicase RecG [Bacteroidaceae bacterium]|jgi:ATP-dependent DNA helicase RecG|nr:ATP-dependent DNA helicase RecG [Bacteroidaceae bacterium]
MLDLEQRNVQYLSGVGPVRAALLSGELQIDTLHDLLYYFPYKYIDRSRIFSISEVDGTMPYIQLKGQILSFEKIGEGRKQRLVAHFTDGTGVADMVWFSGIKYTLDRYRPGVEYVVFGKPTIFGGRVNIAHPEIDSEANLNLSEMGMQPYYNTTERMKKAGLNSAAMRKLIKNLLALITEPLPETLPEWLREQERLMPLTDALRIIHNPMTPLELRLAQLRLKFDELFYIQLNLARFVSERQSRFKGYVFSRIGEKFNRFYRDKLPFELTDAQKRVIREIRNDMGSGNQMNRLLQGDVGSGKTMVALMTMLIAIDNGYQACIMAPTEILSEQHYANINRYLKGLGIKVELLTGSIRGKRRERILKGLIEGSINILVSTHAVLEDNVEFSRLGFVVIDEQHRFGVAQRARLWGKSDMPPHVLVMTATPIPRTLALTLYGDLDVSVIDELPPGRKPIQTEHYYDGNHTSVYALLDRELKKGRQAYIVYPLIEESEKIDLKNLEDGYLTICDRFSGYSVGKVHGRMKSAEKDAEMQRFKRAETQIMVATTVIEVGVDVPNASIMVIENANRFGLSQLHQLRGRVGRGADQSFCLLVTPYQLSEDTRKRIEIMTATCDGFEIAEADLKLRGPGDLEGTQQSGIVFDLRLANLARDGVLIERCRELAREIIAKDPQLTSKENRLMGRILKRLKKSPFDWSYIS